MTLRFSLVAAAGALALLAACSSSSTDGSASGQTDAAAPAANEEPDPPPPPPSLTLESSSISEGQPISGDNAFCVPAEKGNVTFGPNKSPELHWSNVPEGTKSFALIMKDPDVPSVADQVNKEGESISKDLPRVDFYHWVLSDMMPSTRSLAEALDSDGVTKRGKPPGPQDHGARGVNDYSKWFNEDEGMRGEYGGYDGPCPPWNDERVHRYVFTLYALSVDGLASSGTLNGEGLEKAMAGKILAQASLTGTYTLNAALLGGAKPSPAAAPADGPSEAGEPDAASPPSSSSSKEGEAKPE